MSWWLACSSCEWGGNHLLTPRKSLTLLTWLQHCLSGFHNMFLLLGACPVEWGVGLRLLGLFNSSSSYTLVGTKTCYLYCQSLWLGSKVCYSLCCLLPVIVTPPQHWMPKPVTLLHVGHQSLFCMGAKICSTRWQTVVFFTSSVLTIL